MSPVVLNLGCGDKILPGCINVDFPGGNWAGSKPDVECDLRTLTFADGYADRILAIHVLEHFYRYEAPDLLREWRRVLKPGGTIELEMPCLDKVLKLFDVPDMHPRLTLWALYGDPGYANPQMVHRWCYSKKALRSLLAETGFGNVREESPTTHIPIRDMRFIAERVD